MGLIYVNPEGPNGNPDPVASGRDIRDTFGRMAMNDEETVALIAGGHTFGKSHGAGPVDTVGREPEAANIEEQGLGWHQHPRQRLRPPHHHQWPGRHLDAHADAVGHVYFETLFGHEWELTRSPAGAQQWKPKGEAGRNVPDAHIPGKFHQPMMTTADLAMRMDPVYEKISRDFMANPQKFADAFARAWFKLTHRDMGPKVRYLGKLVPEEDLIWQDPVPAVDHPLVDEADITSLKKALLDSGLSVQDLVKTAWASASTFRGTDLRGGANGARIRLEPQKDWEVNEPAELQRVLGVLEKVRADFNGKAGGGRKISLADLIVLGGSAGIEEAARKGGHDITVPFTPGRTDATAEQTDANSFEVLEPAIDAFRNYVRKGNEEQPATALIDRAALLQLTAPQMTVLVGGLRAIGANYKGAQHGVFTQRPGALTPDFFTNLLDMGTKWRKSEANPHVFEGLDRASGEQKWTATVADLVFGSNSQLRALAEVYASSDGEKDFVNDFVKAWVKVMEADRFDLHH